MVAVLALLGAACTSAPTVPDIAESSPELTAATLATVAHLVASDVASGTGQRSNDIALQTGPGLVYAALRANGRLLGSAWAHGSTWADALHGAVYQARDHVPPSRLSSLTTVELDLAYGVRAVPLSDRRREFANIHRGIRGLEIRYGTTISRISPTEMIATNRSYWRQLDLFAEQLGIPMQALADVDLRTFDAKQVLVTVQPTLDAVEMFRGNQLVQLSDVSADAVAAFARRMEDWLIRNVHADGRMTYKYWPSRGEESHSNNEIRQWMATIALTQTAIRRRDAELVALAGNNLRYNLAQFYRSDGELGLIEYHGKVKLGAVALAALAIVGHPNRSQFAREEAALRRTVDYLWQLDGSFRTFYQPRDRNDNQNFYPGEALLLWTRLFQESRNEELLRRIMTSFQYYKVWHLANRNPAFVPWQTQAYAALSDPPNSGVARKWILEMNTWLLTIQRRSAPYPDLQGDFFASAHPEFGPSHAASTGVYLEGLSAAYHVAYATENPVYIAGLRNAICLGLRSALQLEFRDGTDLYYVRNRRAVAGALRTTPYNNAIRIDSVQHMLLAVHSILSADADGSLLHCNTLRD